jgi:hypothetical protein
MADEESLAVLLCFFLCLFFRRLLIDSLQPENGMCSVIVLMLILLDVF